MDIGISLFIAGLVLFIGACATGSNASGYSWDWDSESTGLFVSSVLAVVVFIILLIL